MNDTQPYLAIGVPVLANMTALLVVSGALNKRFDDLRADLGKRMDEANKRTDGLRTEVVKRLERIEIKLEDHGCSRKDYARLNTGQPTPFLPVGTDKRITRVEAETSPIKR